MSHVDAPELEFLLEIEINGLNNRVLIDSGASLSMIKPGIINTELRPTSTATRGITATKLKTNGTQNVTFKVCKRTYDHDILVAPLDAEYSGILGVDALRRMEARVDFRTSTLVLGRTSFQL
jgi:predicted aspartyl protease